MEEEWKDIEGYEGLYQVSNLGRVKSLKDSYGNPREKILKQFKNNKGYLCVNLYKNEKKKTCKIHRLVANAFLENINNLPQVNHKDENKENNLVSNLEWCDASYNQNYGTANQRRVASTDYKAISEKLKNRQDLSKRVYQYDKKGELVAIWQSTQECGRNGYSSGTVAACCRGERKQYKGFIWSYEEIKKGEEN